MKTTILSVVLLASATLSRSQPGLPFLLIWPTARSTALAGAVTGLADDPDAAFFNPAGLAFQSDAGAMAGYGDWLPGVYPDMWQAYVAGRLTRPMSLGRCIALGIDATELNLSDLGISYVDSGWPPPRVRIWRAYAGVSVALRPIRSLGVGMKLKYIRSNLASGYGESGRWPELGKYDGGTGSTWACDMGALWQQSAALAAGFSLANLGPGIDCTDVGRHYASPTMLRLGACWTPLNNRLARVNVLPEFDKVMLHVFSDSVPFRRKLQHELSDVWKTLALEVTAFRLVTARLGYFEDRTNQRGGLLYDNDGLAYRYSLYDLLTRRHLGQLRSIGLCWGFGIGYKDYFRIDVSSDAAIYDFPTSNWKVSLVANDIAGGIRRLKQGHEAREE
jgi:hypothetical protein